MSDGDRMTRVLANPSDGGAHYSIFKIKPEEGMALLRSLFPKGYVDDMNFVIFSTSGVHGSYTTIEDAAAEPDEDGKRRVTVLIVHPRLVCLKYGHIEFELSDVPFLRKLRKASQKVMAEIGS